MKYLLGDTYLLHNMVKMGSSHTHRKMRRSSKMYPGILIFGGYGLMAEIKSGDQI